VRIKIVRRYRDFAYQLNSAKRRALPQGKKIHFRKKIGGTRRRAKDQPVRSRRGKGKNAKILQHLELGAARIVYVLPRPAALQLFPPEGEKQGLQGNKRRIAERSVRETEVKL